MMNLQIWDTCPSCSASRTKKTARCLLKRKVGGTVLMQCFHCGFRGTSNELDAQFNVFEKPFKAQIVPRAITNSECEEVHYLLQRHISLWAILKMGVQYSKSHLWFKCGNGYKVRSIKTKSFFSQGKLDGMFGELINDDYCIIFEGEIDALTGITLGFNNCVSVPYGSGSFRSQRMSEILKTFSNRFKKIIIAADEDFAGLQMATDVMLLLREYSGEVIVLNYNGFKDLNEFVTRATGGEIREWVKRASDMFLRA